MHFRNRVIYHTVSATLLASLLSGCGETGYIDNIDPSAPVSEVETVVDIVTMALEKIKAYADDHTNPAPAVEDYTTVGITGVNNDNLDMVNAAIDALSSIDVDTAAKIQAVVDRVNALEKIKAYAKSSTTQAPAVDDYTTIGITGVNENNIDAVNTLIDAVSVERVDTPEKIQAIVDMVNTAIEKIKAYADESTNPQPTVDDYVTVGITGVNNDNLDVVNSAVDLLVAKDVDTPEKIQSVVDRVNAIEKIKAYAEDSAKPLPTIDDYAVLDIEGVDENNIDIVNMQINANHAAGVDSKEKIQAIADMVNQTLPENVTIYNAASLQSFVVSTYDDDHDLDIQGDINTSGIVVEVPYHADNNTTLDAYTIYYVIDASSTEDGERNVIAKFHWDEQNLTEGNGMIDAHITIDDSEGDGNGLFHAKKLDVEDNQSGLTAATFRYPTDSNGSDDTLALKIIPGILDRNFDLQTNGIYEHRFVYAPVVNSVTGKTWLNNNLGAEYADANNPNGNFKPTQQAKASDDYRAYGSMFQWGRKADGHELINWSSATSGSAKYGTTTTKSDEPDHPLFIKKASGETYHDWRVNPENSLWRDENSTNNVCPIGYRLPQFTSDHEEWSEEAITWSSQNSAGAFLSILKLSTSGYRWSSGGLGQAGSSGNYWYGSAVEDNANLAWDLLFDSSRRKRSADYRSNGRAVRCIKN